MIHSYCINKLMLTWKQEIISACLLPDGNQERRHKELILNLLDFAELSPNCQCQLIPIPTMGENSEAKQRLHHLNATSTGMRVSTWPPCSLCLGITQPKTAQTGYYLEILCAGQRTTQPCPIRISKEG